MLHTASRHALNWRPGFELLHDENKKFNDFLGTHLKSCPIFLPFVLMQNILTQCPFKILLWFYS